MSRFSKAEMLKAELATQDLLRSEYVDLPDHIGRNEEEETKQKDPVSDCSTSWKNRAKRKGKNRKKEVREGTEWAVNYLKLGHDTGILEFLGLAKNIHLFLLIWRALVRRKNG